MSDSKAVDALWELVELDRAVRASEVRFVAEMFEKELEEAYQAGRREYADELLALADNVRESFRLAGH